MFRVLETVILATLVASAYSNDVTSRIYGGTPAGTYAQDASGATTINNEGEYPYIASLQFQGNHICGCVIVKSDVLLTAAHCTRDIPKDKLKVVAGTMLVHPSMWNPSAQERTISRVDNHETFNVTSLFSDDISVIWLDTPLDLNKYVNTVKVVAEHDHGTFVGETVRIMGWGVTERLTPSVNLLYADVQVVENKICTAMRKFKVIDSMICVREPTGVKGACVGDSGGPVVYRPSDDPKTHVLLGITSNVQAAQFLFQGMPLVHCYPIAGSIYTDVASMRAWIDRRVSL